jgi:mRNA-degrading endonuclease toxin of MazEF toxin-antitoxin module
MKAGEIWLVRIPELGTHEQSGTRPAVVVAHVAKTLATIIPCTTNRKALRFPFTSPLEPTAQNGLREASVALVFHLRAIDVSYFSIKLGDLERAAFLSLKKQAHRLIGR